MTSQFLCLLVWVAVFATALSFTTPSNRWLSKVAPSQRLLTGDRSFALNADLFNDIEDEEILVSFKRIVANYLSAKFKDCKGEDCKFSRDRNEISELMRVVLPPCSKDELENEVSVVIAKMGSDDVVMEGEYVKAVSENTYWATAGAFVVKELIFLDCLDNFYGQPETSNLLSNEDYDELKEQLTWEGSVAASVSSKEARFITAVAQFRRGASIMSDTDYETIKSELLSEGSWVVKREQDPLEKLGMNTFMGYLHRSL